MKSAPIALFLLAVLLCSGPPAAAQAKPLSDTDILTLVGLEVPAADIVKAIDKNGYAGPADDASLKKLLKAGAAPEVVLAAKRSAGKSLQNKSAPEQAPRASEKTDIDPLALTLGDVVKRIRSLGGISRKELKEANSDHPVAVFMTDLDRQFKNSKSITSLIEATTKKSGLSEDIRNSIHETVLARGAGKTWEASVRAAVGEAQAWPGREEVDGKLDAEEWLQRHGSTRISDVMVEAAREEIAYHQSMPDGKLPAWAIEQAQSMANFFGLLSGTEERANYIKGYADATYRLHWEEERAKAEKAKFVLETRRKKAEAGDAASQYEYAANSTTLSATERAGWYRKAGDQGHREAQYHLAEYYLHGEGVERSFGEAMKWYHKAAEQGHMKAQAQLAYYYKGGGNYHGDKGVEDRIESSKWLLKAAEQGDRDAQLGMGAAYSTGYGVEKNIIAAISWYRKAADQGHWEAQHRLASVFYEGRDVPPNYPEAVKWWRKSAAQNYSQAEYALGRCYHHGRGVEKDTAEAALWYRKAAARGHEAARKALKELNTK